MGEDLWRRWEGKRVEVVGGRVGDQSVEWRVQLTLGGAFRRESGRFGCFFGGRADDDLFMEAKDYLNFL